MMHKDVLSLLTRPPQFARHNIPPAEYAALVEQFNAFLPVDLIENPALYEEVIERVSQNRPTIRAIWETGEADDPEALKIFNTSIISTASARMWAKLNDAV